MLNQSTPSTFLIFIRLILKSSLILFAGFGSLSLSACGKSEPAANTPASPAPVVTPVDDDHFHDNHAGEDVQVVVSGVYHLEFVAELKDSGVNLDFHLENEDSHKSIPDAKVSATVQSPNGNETTLTLPYEAQGDHYVAFLPASEKGQYNVTILMEVNGNQVRSPFSFEI